MVVLEDYVVDDVPGVGTMGEGDVSPELKEKALKGTVRYLKAKNSWGTNREDRGLTDGYTSFDASYMNDTWSCSNDEGSSSVQWYSALGDFILPPGY